MVSPSIKLAKSNQSSFIEVDSTKELSSLSLSRCDKKICFYYTIIVFVLLLLVNALILSMISSVIRFLLYNRFIFINAFVLSVDLVPETI